MTGGMYEELWNNLEVAKECRRQCDTSGDRWVVSSKGTVPSALDNEP
jgi:hypothetical protein